jgi:Fe2+ or Zn2+ uptake regulation protein
LAADITKLSHTQRVAYHVLAVITGAEDPIHADHIIQNVRAAYPRAGTGDVLHVLTRFEMAGKIRRMPGNLWEITNGRPRLVKHPAGEN